VKVVQRGAVTSFFVVCLVTGSAHAADVLASRNDDGRTGANLEETILTTANAGGDQFGLLFDYDVLDDVYAQPLFVSDLDMPGRGRRNVVFVVNANNDIFAFDADGRLPGETGVLWSRNLGEAERITDMFRRGGDGNIRKHGAIGILGTPVIDRDQGTMFLVSRHRRLVREPRSRFEDRVYEYFQRLHAIDIRTGLERTGSPIAVTAAQGAMVFDPKIQNQRAGLARSGGQIVIAWGAHQDEDAYLGWVMSYTYNGTVFTQTGVFVTTAAGDPGAPRAGYVCLVPFSKCALGGIWQTGRAPAVDSRGRILLFVGNGHNNTDDPSRTTTSFGNSFVILDPVTLAVQDFFTPSNFGYLNRFDLDLGGSGPMIIPDSTQESVVGGGKEGRLYVWNLGPPGAAPAGSALGGFTQNDTGPVQNFFPQEPTEYPLHKDIPAFPGISMLRAGHIMGGPVYWRGPGGGLLYNWSEDAQLRAYAVDPTSPTPVTENEAATGGPLVRGHPGGILSLSANGAEAGSGIVWASTYDAGGDPIEGALHLLKPGTLRAFNAENIGVELWNSDARAGDAVGTLAKFNPPTVANGRVYMAAFGGNGEPARGKLKVYGLRNHRYLRPDQVRQIDNAVRWWQTMAPLRWP
jgi:hypothetical protein